MDILKKQIAVLNLNLKADFLFSKTKEDKKTKEKINLKL